MIKINDFFKDFKLNENVLEHLKETENSFEEYLGMLFKHKDNTIEWFLYDYLVKEISSSYKLENELYKENALKLYDENILNDRVTEETIKKINLFCRNNDKLLNEEEFNNLMKKRGLNKTYRDYLEDLKNNPPGEYRKKNIWLGNPGEGIEYAFHIPPNYEELNEYMKDFMNFFNNNQYNPFVGSALIHMLFIKIHPFSDGNGRTARILMNDYVKEKMKEKYSLNVKYPIINLSPSLNLSKLTYLVKQNNIVFKENINNNVALNKWIDFILNMYDEQINFLKNRLINYSEILEKMDTMNLVKIN